MMLNELSVSGGAWRSLCSRKWVDTLDADQATA
jgi:hypothetical protein